MSTIGIYQLKLLYSHDVDIIKSHHKNLVFQEFWWELDNNPSFYGKTVNAWIVDGFQFIQPVIGLLLFYICTWCLRVNSLSLTISTELRYISNGAGTNKGGYTPAQIQILRSDGSYLFMIDSLIYLLICLLFDWFLCDRWEYRGCLYTRSMWERRIMWITGWFSCLYLSVWLLRQILSK